MPGGIGSKNSTGMTKSKRVTQMKKAIAELGKQRAKRGKKASSTQGKK